jgi:hypothetical protein
MAFCKRGDISESAVFIRHFSSVVKNACTTLPLLSVITVDHSGSAGKGRIRCSNTSNMAVAARKMPVFFIRLDNFNAPDCFNKHTGFRYFDIVKLVDTFDINSNQLCSP